MKLNLWLDYYVYENPPFTGDLAGGSNTLTKVQGELPAVGDRPDIPMLPVGSYVTAVDPAAKTIRFSNSNSLRQSFPDYTFFNGYPIVEMYSSYDLSALQYLGKTLIGGATFYRYDVTDVNTERKDYPLIGIPSAKYINSNTNFKGDTSLHKFRYQPLATVGAGASQLQAGVPSVTGKAAGTTTKITGNDTDIQLTITTTVAVNGDIARIALGRTRETTPIAVLSCGNPYTANNASHLFCNASGLTGLVIGGNLAAGGVYLLNIHVGQ